jgi:hypothetical protein
VQSIGVVAVVGVNGILGKDVRVFYPLVVLQSVTFPSHHVPEATVADPCLKDLGDLPPLIPVYPEDGWRLIVPRVTGAQASLGGRLGADRVQLEVAWWELELVLLPMTFTTLKGLSHLSENLGDGHVVFMSDVSIQTWLPTLISSTGTCQ